MENCSKRADGVRRDKQQVVITLLKTVQLCIAPICEKLTSSFSRMQN
jgi:hypothetical protein